MCDESRARKRMKMDDGEKKMEKEEVGTVWNWNSLPPESVTRILSYLSFHEIAQCRMVCRSFNQSGKTLLNEEAENMNDILNFPYIRTPVHTARIPQFLKLKSKNYGCYKDMRRALCRLYKLYCPYMMDNTSCFVAGKLLDLFYAKLSMTNYAEKNCRLMEELCRLKAKASSHFIENIIPFIVRFHSQSERAKAQEASSNRLLAGIWKSSGVVRNLYGSGRNIYGSSPSHTPLEEKKIESETEEDEDEDDESEGEDNNLLNPVQVWDSEDTDGDDIPNHEYYERRLRKKLNLD